MRASALAFGCRLWRVHWEATVPMLEVRNVTLIMATKIAMIKMAIFVDSGDIVLGNVRVTDKKIWTGTIPVYSCIRSLAFRRVQRPRC